MYTTSVLISLMQHALPTCSTARLKRDSASPGSISRPVAADTRRCLCASIMPASRSRSSAAGKEQERGVNNGHQKHPGA